MCRNFPNLKETDIKIQEALKTPKKLNPNRTTPRYIIKKWQKLKIKKKILKAAREIKSINYKGTPIRLSADFSTKTLQARKESGKIYSKT